MLPALLLIPLLAMIAILVGSPARITALASSGVMLVLGILAAILWEPGSGAEVAIPVLAKPAIALALGLQDGMSVVMMLLTVIVLFSAVASAPAPEGHEKLWFVSSLMIGAGALGAFLSLDLFFFYAFHELALIPTFLMIGILGKGDRKEAAWKITIYLALGSIVLLAGLLALVSASGAENFRFEELLALQIDPEKQRWIAALLLVGFGTLVSLFPFHSWASPAYASAPIPVAMLHAGVLKKFGLYGLIRLQPMVAEGLQSWLGVLIVLLLGNILWVGLVTINQKRLDTLLGNSSVMHMGYIFLAIAALIADGPANTLAIPAATVLMFAHGVSIALLFALARQIELRTGTLELVEMGGLAKQTPRLAFLFGLAAMASIGLPGLANFSGEVLVFLSTFQNWQSSDGLGRVQWATILALWGVVISAVYMLRAFRKIFQGPLADSAKTAADPGWGVKWPALILAVALLVVGIFPKILLQYFPSEPVLPPAAEVVLSLRPSD